jgi:uncharacterized protein
MKKAIMAVLLAGSMAAALTASAQDHSQDQIPGGAINQNLGDFDYGVCRGTDPICFHDWPRPKTTKYRVLLFTHTAGPRHADLGPPLGPGLNPPLGPQNVVQNAMLKLLAKNGITMDYTEDDRILDRLNGYNAVIFFSTSRKALDDDAMTGLRQYMRAGGGFVGIHNAFGTMYNWPYYEGLLGNANYYTHGPERGGDVVIVDTNDTSTKDLPGRWHFTDEWYDLIPFPTKVRFLATVDERSWTPQDVVRREGPPPPGIAPRTFGPRLPSVVGEDPGHGSFHPVAWCQYYDGGKAWLTTLGHDEGDFADSDAKFPGALEFQKLIVGGIKSVMGAAPFCE